MDVEQSSETARPRTPGEEAKQSRPGCASDDRIADAGSVVLSVIPLQNDRFVGRIRAGGDGHEGSTL
eukprot:scaffold1373_cov367-Pinguiococcus_pyrenoidosus.AAC.27